MKVEDKIAKQVEHPFAYVSGTKIIGGAIVSFIIMIFLVPLTESIPALSETDSINIIISVFFVGYLHQFSFSLENIPACGITYWKHLQEQKVGNYC